MPGKVYRTAIYCRLSREDGDKVESNSIASQRAICEDYIARHDDLEIVCEPFVDDGYSGVSFNRPNFKKLEDAIRKGAIDCIVVKDLSRFSRNYIDGGRYLEKIFPQLGIRFIAVNDAYDSLTGDPQSDSFVIPFKNLINDSYCKDISMKIRSSLEVKQKNGEFVGAFAPYGYKKSPDNKNQLIVDEAVSEYVQMIFAMYKDGFSIGRIAARLNQMGVLSPMEYKHSAGVKFDTVFKTGDTAKWTYKAVQRILTNEVYIGVLAQGKRGNVKDKDEWIVFPNTHEAIISREDFQKVQDILQAASEARQTSMQKTEEIRATLVNLFEGKIVCADCGKKMYFHRKRIDKDKRGRWYAYYECSTSVTRRYEHCTSHYTRQDSLVANVLAAIQLQVEAALDYDKLLDKLRGSEGEKNIRDQQNALITSLNLRLNGVSKKRTRLYEDYAEGLLDETEYSFAKKSYDEQYADLSRRLDEAVQRRSKFDEAMSVDNKWITLMKSVSTATQLSQDLVDESVELVKVHEGGAVELIMKYGDIYELTIQSIKEVQEAM